MRPGPVIALTTAMLGAAASAWAQTTPQYLPTRDVAVTYHIDSKDQHVQDVQAIWSSALGRARFTVGPGYLLVDTRNNQATMVMEQAHMAMDLPNTQNYLPDASARYKRGGTDTVAGYRCTIWTASSDKGSGSACLTDDGVILRGTGVNKSGRGGTIEATSVSYGSQPASLFQLPAGIQRLNLLLGGSPKR